MGKKIIVAGGGHGGIAAGMLLAQKGFDVTVYEKNSRENMGYDWTDIFDPDAWKSIGLPMPSEELYEYKVNMTFYSTNEKKGILQQVPEDELEIKMERKDIYNHLIKYAAEKGVQFVFDCLINGAVVENGFVVGIDTDKGVFKGDLVIDACGCDSPVRASLPDNLGVQHQVGKNEKFYIYRAFYNKASDNAEDKYKVCLLPEGKLGIGWVATEEAYTDLLVGRFEPFGIEEANRTAEYFRKKNPSLGTQVVRGGCFAKIPVRQPLSLMVADGYAAIGDSAFMTVPIIGSGIANTIKAAPLLAEAVLSDKEGDFTAEALWRYQYNFYKQMGKGLAPLAAVKLLLTKLTPEELDYVFEKNILTYREMTISAKSTSISSLLYLSWDMPARGMAILKNKKLLKKLLGVVSDVSKIVFVCASLPRDYDREKVFAWKKKYDSLFE